MISLRVATTAVLLMSLAPAASAQIRADSTAAPPSEPGRTLLALRDSVDRVGAELTRFQRDLQLAGEQTVVSRARRLGVACAGLRRAMADGASVLSGFAAANAPLAGASRDLQSQMRATSRTLEQECEVGLAPEGPGVWADSLKAWGPHRTSLLQQSLGAYERSVASFARAAGIDLTPRRP